MKIYRGERKLFIENPNSKGRQLQVGLDLTPKPLTDDELDYMLTKKELPENKKNSYRRYCYVTVNSEPLSPVRDLISKYGGNFEWGYRGKLCENLSASIVLDLLKQEDTPDWFTFLWELYPERHHEEGFLDYVVDIFVIELMRRIVSNLNYENWKLEEIYLNKILTDIAIEYSNGRLSREPENKNSLLTK